MSETNHPQLAAIAASIIKARAKHIAQQKKADEFKKALAELEAKLLEELRETKVESVRVKGYNFTPGTREIVETYDWDAYWQWARKDKLGVYVERRPAKKAVYEQINDGVQVPGVRPGKVAVLHVTQASKK